MEFFIDCCIGLVSLVGIAIVVAHIISANRPGRVK
jgi:hypothetical protein